MPSAWMQVALKKAKQQAQAVKASVEATKLYWRRFLSLGYPLKKFVSNGLRFILMPTTQLVLTNPALLKLVPDIQLKRNIL